MGIRPSLWLKLKAQEHLEEVSKAKRFEREEEDWRIYLEMLKEEINAKPKNKK